jgi:Uma2 family endonuclease
MGMPAEAVRWTREMVQSLPEDGKRYELIDGALIVTPSPGVPHQSVLSVLFRKLSVYALDAGVGRVLSSPADLQLERGEILQPDLFVVGLATDAALPMRWERIRDLLLVVEIISPSSVRTDRISKRLRYQRARVPEYWVVDPFARVIERWQPDDDRPAQLADTLTWQPNEAHPPLVIDIEELFREALGEEGVE